MGSLLDAMTSDGKEYLVDNTEHQHIEFSFVFYTIESSIPRALPAITIEGKEYMVEQPPPPPTPPKRDQNGGASDQINESLNQTKQDNQVQICKHFSQSIIIKSD